MYISYVLFVAGHMWLAAYGLSVSVTLMLMKASVLGFVQLKIKITVLSSAPFKKRT